MCDCQRFLIVLAKNNRPLFFKTTGNFLLFSPFFFENFREQNASCTCRSICLHIHLNSTWDEKKGINIFGLNKKLNTDTSSKLSNKKRSLVEQQVKKDSGIPDQKRALRRCKLGTIKNLLNLYTRVIDVITARQQGVWSIINAYSMKQPDLYCFETIKMAPLTQSNFVWRIRDAGEYSL